jgi:glycosyltransferase involved in cell wall biosynthesis
MKPIRLAVIFDQQISAGGAFQQALNAALLAKSLPNSLVECVFFTTHHQSVALLSTFDIPAQYIKFNIFQRLWARVRGSITNTLVIKGIKSIQKYCPLERILIKNRIDLVYFLSPTIFAKYLENLNYITTVWDLCHRDDPEFPEVRSGREFEARDSNYNAILPRATAILVDSEIGRGNVVRRYAIDFERIHVMPFEPSISSQLSNEFESNINIRVKFNLDVPYVFYPAQFWAHKNHVYVLEGLKVLESLYNMRIGAIFSGGDKGNKTYIEKYAKELGLIDRVRFVGFLTNEEIVSLYKQSLALVMPSYFGPTNLPPLEAFEIGVPVLYSDKLGLRDQIGDAALLLNLNNPQNMAEHVKNLVQDEGLRQRLVNSGRHRLAHFNAIDRLEILKEIIEDYRWRRLCWE